MHTGECCTPTCRSLFWWPLSQLTMARCSSRDQNLRRQRTDRSAYISVTTEATQSNSRTIQQSHNRTVAQSNSPTIEQSHNRTVAQSNSRTIEQPHNRTVAQSHNRTVKQLNSRTIRGEVITSTSNNYKTSLKYCFTVVCDCACTSARARVCASVCVCVW